MRLDVYNIKDLQHCMTILGQFEAAGVTDIGAVRERLQGRITEAMQVTKITDRKVVHGKHKNEKCPYCDRGVISLKKEIDGLLRRGCCSCHYSEVVS